MIDSTASAPRGASSMRARPDASHQSVCAVETSGRAEQRTRIGCGVGDSTRWVSRSRNVASAAWMSSTTTTTGRVDRQPLEEPARAPEDLGHREVAGREAHGRDHPVDDALAVGVVVGQEGRDLVASRRAVESSSRIPAALRTISTRGQNVMPSP